jgi:pimeloyl-ACP methyl ester carboxylesterase
VKKTFISAAAILAFTAAGHADELADIQALAKQLREQMTKRFADLEKRQKALESQKPVATNPVDAMAADLPYKAAVKAKPVENDDVCVKGILQQHLPDARLILYPDSGHGSHFQFSEEFAEEAARFFAVT